MYIASPILSFFLHNPWIRVVNVAAVGTNPLRITLSKTIKASSIFPYWQRPLITILSATSVGIKPNDSTSSLIWKAPCNYLKNIPDVNPTSKSSKKHIKRGTIRCNTFQVHLLQKLQPNVIQQSTLIQTCNQCMICYPIRDQTLPDHHFI